MFSLFAAAILLWDAPVDNVTGHLVWQGTESTVYSRVVDVVGSTNNSWVITPLEPWTKYFFAVTAYNDEATSDFSEEVSFTWTPEYIRESSSFTFFVQPDEVLEKTYNLNSWISTGALGIVTVYFSSEDFAFYRKRKIFTTD